MNARCLLNAILPFAFYAGIACIALSPLLFHAQTHTGGEWTTDYYHFHWNFWWIRHALTTPGLTVYETDFVLYPFTTNLALHTLTPFWYPAWALLEPLFGGGRAGTMGAMDVIMVAAMTLTGWSFYQLLRREGVSTALALPFGVIFQVCSGMMLAAMLTTINYLSGFWLPLNLLTWGEIARAQGRRRWMWAALLGLAFYGTMLTDYQHMLFLAFLLIPYGVWTLIRQRNWRDRFTLAAAGVAALAIMTALLWVAGPLPYLLRYDFSGLSPQPIENAGGIPFPAGFFSRFGTYDRGITLGSLVLPLVIVALIVSVIQHRTDHLRRPNPKQTMRASKWFWLCLLIVPLIMSAGAFVSIGGTTVDAPYAWMHRLLGGLFRSPARFDYAIIVAALLFAGKALTPLIQCLPQRLSTARLRLHPAFAAAPLLFLAAWDSQLFIPMPIQPVTPDYDYYKVIGGETGEGYDDRVVLEVPVAGGSGEAWVGDFKPMEAQFYGMTHGKRMLNGAIARAPLSHFWYWLYDDRMLAWFGQRRYLEPEVVENQLRERIADWKLGWIVVHGDWIGIQQPAFVEIVGWLNGLEDDLVCLAAVEGNTLFYETALPESHCIGETADHPAPGVFTFDVGAQADVRFLGWGWHYAEDISGVTMRWTGVTPEAALYADLLPGSYRMSITAQAFHEPRILRVRINDALLAETAQVSTDSLGSYAFSVPAEAVGDGNELNITLEYDATVTPAEVGLGGDKRELAIAVDRIEFTCTDEPSSETSSFVSSCWD